MFIRQGWATPPSEPIVSLHTQHRPISALAVRDTYIVTWHFESPPAMTLSLTLAPTLNVRLELGQ